MNPFDLLNVDKSVTQKDIIRAAAFAMQEKKYSASEIAIAQKTLLDPVSRGCEEFLYHLDLSEDKEKLNLDITEAARKYTRSDTRSETGEELLNKKISNLNYLDLFH